MAAVCGWFGSEAEGGGNPITLLQRPACCSLSEKIDAEILVDVIHSIVATARQTIADDD